MKNYIRLLSYLKPRIWVFLAGVLCMAVTAGTQAVLALLVKPALDDIFIAKNYLSEDEIDTLNRLVVIFLETAELRAKNRQDITMNFWRENVDRILEFNDKQILKTKGKISNAEMEQLIRKVYAEFDKKRKAYDAQLADKQDLEELKQLEEKLQKKK